MQACLICHHWNIDNYSLSAVKGNIKDSNDHTLSWLGTATMIKSGGGKLVHMPEILGHKYHKSSSICLF